MAEKKEKGKFDDHVYVVLQVHEGLRRGLISLCLWSFALLIIIFFGAGSFGVPQQIVGFVSILTVVALVAYPLSEDWVYRPWQKSLRKVERHVSIADSDVEHYYD
jgi:hypothetical protein